MSWVKSWIPHRDVTESLLGRNESHSNQVILEERRPYGTLVWTFLVLHYLPILAQLYLMCMAALEGAWLILGCTAAALAFSGVMYGKVAWSTVVQGSRFLPLSGQPLWVSLPLLVPYGLLQWVIVELNFLERRSSDPRSSATYKAANAIVESILTSAALLYTHWTVGLPGAKHFYDGNGGLLVCQLIVVASGGLGLLQMDYCCSAEVRQRMGQVPHYMLSHAAYRTCEVVSRLSLLTGFAVVATFHSAWWAVMVVDLGISTILVLVHSGVRNSAMATAICIVSSSIVNVFVFVDSPTRVQSARNVSFWLTAKYLVEILLVFAGMFLVMDWEEDLSLHLYSLLTAIIATVLYWALWAWLRYPKYSRLTWHDCFLSSITDDNIFSACRNGNLEAVRRLTTGGEVVFDLDEFDVCGLTPLMHAAIGGNAAICRQLLSVKATLNLKTIEDAHRFSHIHRKFWPPAGRHWTALHMAAWKGHSSVLSTLLHRLDDCLGDELECVDVDDNTPLHIAGMFGHCKAFQVIAENSQEWADLPNKFDKLPQDPSPGIKVTVSLRSSETRPNGRPGGAVQEDQRELVPIIRNNGCTLRHEVPLGLSSFLVCKGSGRVGRSLVPARIVSPGTAAFEERQVSAGGHAGGIVRVKDLQPCTTAGVCVPGAEDPTSSEVWRDGRVMLGEGSYGVVWCARDAEGQMYAVKCIANQGTAPDGDRHESNQHSYAIREVQVALAVRSHEHACLLKFYSIEQLPRHICLVMEYCAGGTLQKYLRTLCADRARAGTGLLPHYTPPSLTWQWMAQVFLGLEYIHLKMHAIHRDIKPDNVGLSRSAGSTDTVHAVILDYGGCRLTGASPGHYTFAAEFPQGTPGYVSPELVRGWAYDQMTDFYSFGAMIWVVLTGGWSKSVTVPHTEHFRRPLDLRNDYLKLQEVLRNPEKYRQNLSKDAQSLLLKLTEFWSRWRCSHDEVRRMLTLPTLLGRPLPQMEPLREVTRSTAEKVRRMLTLPTLLGRALPQMEPLREVTRWVTSL